MSHGHLCGISSNEFAAFSNLAVSRSAASELTCTKNAAWETSLCVARFGTINSMRTEKNKRITISSDTLIVFFNQSLYENSYLLAIAACAAARRAIGTRNGEQDT